ncbi:hypothetical protein [Haloarchaeobius sp. TZWWS8]|uniref:hypothetical protein n=1 Tax=Haloarchaeobius sp. TZWWS8 TaxID=3446121 RepID=UPI003EBE7DEC
MSRESAVRNAKLALGGVVAAFALVLVATVGLNVAVAPLSARETTIAALGAAIALVGLVQVVYAEAFTVWLLVLLSGADDYETVEVDADDVKQRRRGGYLMLLGGVVAIAVAVL